MSTRENIRLIARTPYIEFGSVVQEEMLFKDISHLELWWLFCSAEGPFVQFGRRHFEEYLCEIILNLYQWFRRYCLKLFLI